MNNAEFKTGQIRPVECYKEGWELIKNDYWILFAVAIVGAVIGGISLYILLGAMACGIFYTYLQKIDTGTTSFENLWKGFNYLLPGLIVTMVIVVPMLFVYALIYVPVIMAMMMGARLSQEEFMGMLVGVLAIDFVIILVMVCFHTLLMFAFPLIIDRNMSAMQAMKTSCRAVWANLSGVAGVIGIYFLSIIPGILTCGFGMYFLMPIMIAGFLVAYRKVFPALENQNFEPPPPNAYQGAGSYT